MRSDFFSFSFTFFDPRNEKHLLVQSEGAKLDRKKSELRIRWPKTSDFGSKFEDFGDQVFKWREGMVSKFKMLSTQHAAADDR